MACTDFFALGRNPSPQRTSLPPLPQESRIDETCGIPPTHVLRKQSPVKASAAGTRGALSSSELFQRSQERREQRKLRRAAASSKTQAMATRLSEIGSPGSPHTSKPHQPPYTIKEISNYLNAPNKLTRKSFTPPVPYDWYQDSVGTPLMLPPGSRQSATPRQDSPAPYSESRGELQRQSAISQRLQRKYQSGAPSPIEVGAYLGRLERLHDGDGWVDGFRLEVEKPLQRVYARRLQEGGRGSVMIPEKPKKVRFASVVECFEF